MAVAKQWPRPQSADPQSLYLALNHIIDLLQTGYAGADVSADDVSVTAAGNIAATNVQDALEELDDEKLAKASNLSDLADAETARTNLGTAIGTDVQAHNAGLDDIAGLTKTKGNLIAADGSNWAALGIGTNDQVLTADSTAANGVKWADPAGGSGLTVNTQVFTSSGTYTKPAGLVSLEVWVTGGTGGGAGGGNAGDGGTSSFGAHCSATGGVGGSRSSSGGDGGAGGTGSGGDLNLTGQTGTSGASGTDTNVPISGGASAGPFGTVGGSGNGGTSPSGGGGGGGASYKFIDAGDIGSTETVTIGAAGTAGSSGGHAGVKGIVFIREYISS